MIPLSTFLGGIAKRLLECSMHKAMSNLLWLLLISLMVVATLTFLAPSMGWGVATVLSGSMEPELQVGSIVISRPVEANAIRQGDIISFYSPDDQQMTTHRVLAIGHSSDFYFQAGGDANEDPDGLVVPYGNVIGKVVYHIPYLGYAAQFIKSPLGLVLTLYIPGMAIVMLEMKHILRVLRFGTSDDVPVLRSRFDRGA